ncbi:bacteriocin, partial [Streptococcus pneumoniae]
MKAIFFIILFAFQTYLIYLSISISDKKQKTIELTSLNCFVILFLI